MLASGRRIVTNTELASLVSDISNRHVHVISDSYEAGEMIDGKFISFEINAGSPLWKSRFAFRGRRKEP